METERRRAGGRADQRRHDDEAQVVLHEDTGQDRKHGGRSALGTGFLGMLTAFWLRLAGRLPALRAVIATTTLHSISHPTTAPRRRACGLRPAGARPRPAKASGAARTGPGRAPTAPYAARRRARRGAPARPGYGSAPP